MSANYTILDLGDITSNSTECPPCSSDNGDDYGVYIALAAVLGAVFGSIVTVLLMTMCRKFRPLAPPPKDYDQTHRTVTSFDLDTNRTRNSNNSLMLIGYHDDVVNEIHHPHRENNKDKNKDNDKEKKTSNDNDGDNVNNSTHTNNSADRATNEYVPNATKATNNNSDAKKHKKLARLVHRKPNETKVDFKSPTCAVPLLHNTSGDDYEDGDTDTEYLQPDSELYPEYSLQQHIIDQPPTATATTTSSPNTKTNKGNMASHSNTKTTKSKSSNMKTNENNNIGGDDNNVTMNSNKPSSSSGSSSSSSNNNNNKNDSGSYDGSDNGNDGSDGNGKVVYLNLGHTGLLEQPYDRLSVLPEEVDYENDTQAVYEPIIDEENDSDNSNKYVENNFST